MILKREQSGTRAGGRRATGDAKVRPRVFEEEGMIMGTALARSRSTAQEIRFWMSTPAITITVEAEMSEALAVMHEHSIRRLPVINATGALCGIITDGDIRGADVLCTTGIDPSTVAAALRHTTIFKVMTHQPVVVGLDTTLREAAILMLDHKIGGLPVVDAAQRIVGVITESDLFEALVCYLDHAERTA
jgi:CBS domain-containing protein